MIFKVTMWKIIIGLNSWFWWMLWRDAMSHSFGEGYATRSDEEGFGGIYGGKQSMPNTEKDKIIHENHPGLISLSHATCI